MTDFLKINGVAVPVADGSARGGVTFIGEAGRSVSGQGWRDFRSAKRIWAGALQLSAPATALAFRGLLSGLHDVWSFEANNVYSAKGVPLDVDAGVVVTNAQKKFGTYSLEVPTTKSFDIAFVDLNPAAAPWAVAWWHRQGGVWYHYVEQSTGVNYVDGVVSLHTPFWTGGGYTLTFSQSSGASIFVDDVATYPFVFPTSWPAQLAATGSATPDAPKLRAEGSSIDNNVSGGVTVLSLVGDGESYVQAISSGTLTPNFQSITFELQEV
jgi:hypothetical protein